MNGPHLDAAVLSSRLVAQHPRDNSESEINTNDLLYTIALLASGLNTGMNDGLVAPTMADLELVTGGTPESVSVMFTLRAIFVVIGSIVGERILQKWPETEAHLIGVALILESLFGTVSPWLPTVVLLDLTSGIAALFTGAIMTGTYSRMQKIWRNGASAPVKALRLAYTFGIGLASLIALPFLWQQNLLEIPHIIRSPASHRFCKIPIQLNGSLLIKERTKSQRSTHVQIAYFIVALTGILLSLVFFILPSNENMEQGCQTSKREHESKPRRNQNLRRGYNNFIFILFMIFTALFGGMEICFTGLLISYSYNFLGWGKKEAVLMSAMYQMVKFIFAVVGAVIGTRMSQIHILFYQVLIVVATSVYLLETISCDNHVSMWVCTLFFALGNSSLFPFCLSWIGEKVQMWRKLAGLFNVSFCIGVMVLPILTAHLLVNYGYKSLPWVLLFCSCFGFLAFLLLLLLLECFSVESDTSDEYQVLLEHDPEIYFLLNYVT